MMRCSLAWWAAVLLCAEFCCSEVQGTLYTEPILWKDASQPFDKRAEDLASRLSFEDIVKNLNSNAPGAITTDGDVLPPISYGQECLAGWSPPPTSNSTAFPHMINMGATFDPTLARRMGSAIGSEARAWMNAHASASSTCLAPSMNIARDPRWGRSYESISEDPFTVGVMAAEYVRGMTKGLPKDAASHYIKFGAIGKHIGAYSLECWCPKGIACHPSGKRDCAVQREYFNAIVDPTDLHETYLAGWRAAGRAGLTGAMCSLNAVNGVPACADKEMLDELRSYGAKGYVVSDSGAGSGIYDTHHYAANYTQAAALAIQAGMDVEMGSSFAHLSKAVAEGMTTVDAVRRAMARSLYARFATGQFDPPNMSAPWSEIPVSIINGPEHITLAREIAERSFVLLKHENHTLPLKQNLNIGVFGATATDQFKQINRYTGRPTHTVTILQGLQERANGTVHDFTTLSEPEIRDAALSVDIAVVAVQPTKESEDFDREYDIGVTGMDELLLHDVAVTGKPVILVVVNGGATTIPEWAVVPGSGVVAIVDSFTGGEQAGPALAALLHGDVDFSGRLPTTIYHNNWTSISSMTDMSMRDGVGRGYRYLKDESLQQFPFGFGLSYNSWALKLNGSPATISASDLQNGKTLRFTVDATNGGTMAGRRSVLAMMRRSEGGADWAKRWVFGLNMATAGAGESALVDIELTAASVSRWDAASKSFKVAVGKYTVSVLDGIGEIEVSVVTK